MAFTEDMTVFFDSDDHAVEATVYQTSIGFGGVSVKGIFDAESVFVDMGYAGADSIGSSFTCATSYIGTNKRNWYLDIDGTEYKIVRVQPDGTGVSVCQLEATT